MSASLWIDWGRRIARPTRERLGLTRAQLAGKTGLSPETVRNLEMGYVHRPTRRTLRLVAVALDIYLPDDEWLRTLPGGKAPEAVLFAS